MKKNLLNKWGYALMIALVGIGMTFTSCGTDNDDNEAPTTGGGGTGGGSSSSKDPWANLVNENVKKYGSESSWFIYGWGLAGNEQHSYSDNGSINLSATTFDKPTAIVGFTHVPSGFTEFKAVYENWLGTSMHGVAAMIPMAFEIYARDRATGLKCLNLLCDREQTVNQIVPRLNDLFDLKATDGARYLPATMLRGATFDNAYTPTLNVNKEYEVSMCRAANAPQDTDNPSYGTVYYVYIFMDGYEGGKKQVEIFKDDDSKYYKVQNCSNMYVRPKKIKGTWQGLK